MMAVMRVAEELRQAALDVIEAWHGNGSSADAIARLQRVSLEATASPEYGRSEPELKLAGEIRPGGWYVLQADRNLRPQEAMRMREKLDQLFPGATFAILDKAMSVTQPVELIAALKRARTKVNQEWERAHEQSRIALSGAAYALDYLARELATPERDGAGALPDPSEPVGATQPPAPSRPRADYHQLESCGVHHRNYLGILHPVSKCELDLCGRVPR